MSMARPPKASRQTRRLLAAMLEQPRSWRYGYDLAQETGIKSGTFHPLLVRRRDQGLLDSRWKSPEQPNYQ